MNIGTQLEAPDGFQSLVRGITYHLLSNDYRTNRVILMSFVKTKRRRRGKGVSASQDRNAPISSSIRDFRAELSYLSCRSFEQALIDKEIVACQEQQELPPWFGGMSIESLRTYEQKNLKKRKSHQERIDRVLIQMAPLIDNLQAVLLDKDPARYVNAFIKRYVPDQNITRLRTAFFAYLCYQRTRWVLHFSVHHIGKWDRTKNSKKLGRKSKRKGAKHGHSMCDPILQEKMEHSYEKHRGYGAHLTKIYRDTLKSEFDCVVRLDAYGRKEFVNLEGKPFPTFDQFFYCIDKKYSLRERQRDKYGAHRMRDQLMHSQGKFTESVGNLMEKVEQDAYVCDQVPKGLLTNSHLPALTVVRLRCVASGMMVGIGFSVGAEDAAAYRMAMFCCAIDKVKFCRIFGIRITHDQWPSIGLPLAVVNDRGPGSTSRAFTADANNQPLVKEITPSQAGQSKSIIETSHPKSVNLQGGSYYIETSQTLPQLAMQEIFRLLADNNGGDVSSRLNNSAVAAGVLGVPNALWRYLGDRGRTMATCIQFADAVRRYLTPIELTVHDDGVYFGKTRFTSEALKKTLLMQKAHQGGRYKVKGFMYDVCLRHLWVDLDVDLVEVDAQFAIASGDEELYLSVLELAQLDQIRRDGQRDVQEHQLAVRAGYEADYESLTGRPFGEGQYKKGRNRRSKANSKQEAREVVERLRAAGGRR